MAAGSRRATSGQPTKEAPTGDRDPSRVGRKRVREMEHDSNRDRTLPGQQSAPDVRLAAGARGADALAARIMDREQALAEREATLEAEHAHISEAAAARIDNGRRRLKARENALSEQAQELAELEQRLEEREAELAQREARVLVELDLREEALEVRERAVAEQDQRLQRKEQDLTRYVGQLQGRLAAAS